MTISTDQPFDLIGALPTGRLAIQASAGTGKTYTLAALATRFVAERDVSASELLVVTFTRAATTELRSRIRDRMAQAATYLRDPAGTAHADSVPDTDDDLLVHLGLADRELRRERLERAVVEFDAATITTIHGFATQVLGTLGTTSGTDLDAKLVDDTAELSIDACADVLAWASTQGHPAADLPTFTGIHNATRTALNIADLVLAPGAGEPGATDAQVLLAELVQRAMDLMDQRRRDAGTLSFDDILLELRRALDGPGRDAALETIRNRFRVVLIDEFQDTDPVQWAIFSTLFDAPDAAAIRPSGAAEDRALVLVGDPKQAVYAFRGANVHTYLDAVSAASGTNRASLATNFRSDGAVIASIDTLLDGATFGDDAIAFAPVSAAPAHERLRLRSIDGAVWPALSIRLALGEDIKRNSTKPFDIASAEGERAICSDLASRVRDLLDSAVLPDTRDGAEPSATVAVRPSDIAVLVRTGSEASAVQNALTACGVPAVLAKGGSVLLSPAAEQWRWLLEALARPSDPTRARTFALSWFAGRTAEWIDGATDDELGELQDRLHDWSDILLSRGVVEFVRRVWSDSGVVARVLARADGDRAVTDLDHIGELLQTASPTGRATVAGLLSALETDPIVDLDEEIDDDVAARRIESEAQAVKIMTVWVAKGLEFPIVCVPTMWRKRPGKTIYQDPLTGRRTFDVGKAKGWPDKDEAKSRGRRAELEAEGENLRLLYVALTRARHHTILWWTRSRSSDSTALARILFARNGGRLDPDQFRAPKIVLPADADALAILDPIIQRSAGTIVAEVHGRPTSRPERWIDPVAVVPTVALCRAALGVAPDRSGQRWSFTAITARSAEHVDPFDVSMGDAGAADEQGSGDAEVPDDAVADMSHVTLQTPPGELTLFPVVADVPALLAGLPAGASFGTFVHSVLEEVDFASADLGADLSDRIDHQLQRRALDLTPVGVEAATSADGRELVIDGLSAAIHTPLGPMFGGRRLSDLSRRDRLDELSFELRLGEAGAPCTERDIGRLIASHLDEGDRLRPWADALAQGDVAARLAGHLTGSIDAVLRVVGEDGAPRFVVVDYKTNRLTPRGAAPAASDYHPDAMAVAMSEHHYPVQALLYSVALHRYLRWRLDSYRPEIHLGGAAYLFLRGMIGPLTPTDDGMSHGVFSWSVPSALVVELSDLLDGRPRASTP